MTLEFGDDFKARFWKMVEDYTRISEMTNEEIAELIERELLIDMDSLSSEYVFYEQIVDRLRAIKSYKHEFYNFKEANVNGMTAKLVQHVQEILVSWFPDEKTSLDEPSSRYIMLKSIRDYVRKFIAVNELHGKGGANGN